jgi:CxxC-x17-CxxC domain-containing protein
MCGRDWSSDVCSSDLKLYDAICSSCGKNTKVIFPPEKGRPVYCKNCLKKNHPVKSNEVEQLIRLEDIPFHSPKKNNELNEKNNHEKPKRKEINLSELRKALEESLENKQGNEEIKNLPINKQGEIKPGQTIKF